MEREATKAAREARAGLKIWAPAAPSPGPGAPPPRALTQHLDPGLGLDAAGWGAAHAAVPRAIIHLHAVDAQGPVLGDFEPRVLWHTLRDCGGSQLHKCLQGSFGGRSARELVTEESPGRGFCPLSPGVSLILTSEMSIWFLYQTTVGFGVAWVRQCK